MAGRWAGCGGNRRRQGSSLALPLRSCRAASQQRVWVPSNQRKVDFSSRQAPEAVVYAGQGPPPPSPIVVERFQQVISQLFQQVRLPSSSDCDCACSAAAMKLGLKLLRPVGRQAVSSCRWALEIIGLTLACAALPPARSA